MKRKLLALTIICLCGCTQEPQSQPTDTTEEICTTEEKAVEKDTEGVEVPVNGVESPTKAVEMVVTTPPEEVLTAKRMAAERKNEEQTEDTTGHIDVNGYGWVELQYSAPYNIMDGHLTRSNGSIRVFGHRETWYSTNEGCGQNTAVPIPGKHVADDGTIRDGDGFICVASSDLAFYSIVMTSLGPAKVYDCGCSHGTIDVYTDW